MLCHIAASFSRLSCFAFKPAANTACGIQDMTFIQGPGMGLDLRVCRRTPSWARERAFFRLTKTAKQAMFVISSIQPDAVRRKKGRSKPDRVFRQAPRASMKHVSPNIDRNTFPPRAPKRAYLLIRAIYLNHWKTCSLVFQSLPIQEAHVRISYRHPSSSSLT